jgi:hypothetical protein
MVRRQASGDPGSPGKRSATVEYSEVYAATSGRIQGNLRTSMPADTTHNLLHAM